MHLPGRDARSSRVEEERSAARPHVVVVDDEAELCELIGLRLEHHGYRVSSCQTGREALALLERERVDALILDLRLEGEDGMDVLRELRQRGRDVPVIVLTAHGTIELAVEATRYGAHGFMTKPFEHRELLERVATAAELARQRREVSAHDDAQLAEPERLLGGSERMRAVRDALARAARSEATVLILGESGAGKEVAARSLHAQSGRTGRFVALNCAALPSELLESELFGYLRGAFTGATRDKEGLFAAAQGGTLFLDEIGDAPASLQVKLLRVLQELSYLPIGSTEPRSVDVRIVAATNRDLRASMQAGQFREDLFYRLHVLPLALPPLRERREDIPLLAERFLARAVQQYGLEVRSIDPATIETLLAHDWPGNVRELGNVIEGAALLCGDPVLEPRHVLPVLHRPQAAREEAAVLDPRAKLEALLGREDSLPSLREVRTSVERAYLEHVLRRCKGNVSAAARLAGRNRTDFYDLLRRYELEPLSFRS
jgi:two-component system response regulator GlrR